MKAAEMERIPETNIENAWQQQPRENPRFSLEDIRAKAQHVEVKVRWWRRVGGAALIVAVIAEIVQVWVGRDLVERSGDLLTIAAILYISYEYGKHARSAPERAGPYELRRFLSRAAPARARSCSPEQSIPAALRARRR